VKTKFKASFVKDLKNATPEILHRVQLVREQIELTESIDLISNIKKLKNSKNYYRIRARVGWAEVRSPTFMDR
jgi:mRNA-degrading endonuclease RelE of RelBE toxin-antitoxin system